MRQRVSELISIGDVLFAKKIPILSLWQAIAEQFDPMRADYTYVRSIGMEFYSHLMTGAAVMASRDLANAINAMLRPPGQPWFHARTQSEMVNHDSSALIWLDWASEQMRLAMYDSNSGWTRAAKEADRDYVTIGNALIFLHPNESYDGLLYKTLHMRDAAWAEGPNGRINQIHVKRSISKRNMVKLFPKTVSEKVKDAVATLDGNTDMLCRHIVLPTDEYDSLASASEKVAGGVRQNRRKLPFTSVWGDTENETILEEIGQGQMGYIPPRWETTAGFHYGYSPATGVNIADARMLQQVTLTLLEAGQKQVDPPWKAVGEMIQGGVNTYAGGITWVEADYDERTGAALEPLFQGGQRDLGWGVQREEMIVKLIKDGHYLSQIKLPDSSHAQTAFEIQKLWEEYVRATTPLFEPIQVDYNAKVCDETFEMMLRMNAFGDMRNMPKVLRAQDIRFQFDTPLTMASGRADAQAFTAMAQMLQAGMAIDPNVKADIDTDTAFRDAVLGTGAPARWIVPKAKADAAKAAARKAQAAQAQMQSTIATAGAAGDAGAKVGQAANLLQQGGILAPQQVQPGGLV